MTQLEELLQNAKKATDKQEEQNYYMSIINQETTNTEDVIKIKEEAYYQLSVSLAKEDNNEDKLGLFLSDSISFFENISKAKATKIIRKTIENIMTFIKSKNYQKITTSLVKLIEWSVQTKQTFLKQFLEMSLTQILIKDQKHKEALDLIDNLLKELKKVDDKINSVEVLLLQSEVYYKIRNLAKSKSALTAARTTANSVYCPQKIQAKLDLQSGILNCEDNDYKTGYSYFYESFEAYDTMKHPNAELVLKYMLLCKIMVARFEEFNSVVNTKLALKYNGQMIETMKQLNTAYQNRSIKEFEMAFQNNKKELEEDKIVYYHLKKLYESLLEQNILKIIEPYSHVEISYIAQLLELNSTQVENKLSQMILDKQINGVLDMQNNCLELLLDVETDKTYQDCLLTLKNMGLVVDHLVLKASSLG